MSECCMASAVSCVLTFPDQVGGGWSTAAQPSLVPCHLDNKVAGGAQLLAQGISSSSVRSAATNISQWSRVKTAHSCTFDVGPWTLPGASVQTANTQRLSTVKYSGSFWFCFFRGLCLDKLRPHGIACHGGRHVQIGSYFNNVHAR